MHYSTRPDGGQNSQDLEDTMDESIDYGMLRILPFWKLLVRRRMPPSPFLATASSEGILDGSLALFGRDVVIWSRRVFDRVGRWLVELLTLSSVHRVLEMG
mmetsp:Transcript_2397/g.4148  ORF Transcript_2397/g.4148 Transcript_2397/m.4148 type:complete len:101 (+) Transcript_2397:53-355(+)